MLKELFSCFRIPEKVQEADCKSDFGTYKPYRYPKGQFRRYNTSNISVRVTPKARKSSSMKKPVHGMLTNLLFANEKKRKIEKQRRSELLKIHGRGTKRTIVTPKNRIHPVTQNYAQSRPNRYVGQNISGHRYSP